MVQFPELLHAWMSACRQAAVGTSTAGAADDVGQEVALRVLSQDPVLLDLADLGLSELALALVVSHVRNPFGMVLVTGPYGSGKTTGVYALLMRVASKRQSIVNISTVEDPIE